MSDSPPPVKPKPGSLRDRIAAFEHKPAPSSPAPPAPRPKPGNLSQWKPHAPSPPESQPPTNRNDPSMSASDAKESITKAGGSLKERMALLQGLGAFGGGQAAAPPPRPAEKPRWKPPPQVALAPPVIGDDGEDDSASTGGVDNKPAIEPLKAPSDDIVAALSKPPPPAQEGSSEIEGEGPTRAEEEEVDPDEEERERRAAIAARMARLGGTRVGMGPPIFGRKPEIKPKPAMPAPEATREGPSTADVPVAERDVEHAQAETDVAVNVPLPTSPPIDETATGTLSPQSQNAGSEYFPQQSPPSVSPNILPRAMPVPQGPRRAAPPRKKAASKPTPPAETEAATRFLEKDTPMYDSPDVVSENQSAPAPALGHVGPEVGATDANTAGSLSEPTDEQTAPLPRPVSPPSDPRSETLDTSGVDLKPRQDLPPPDDTIETAIPSSPGIPGIMQEGSEVEEVLAPEPGEDETAEAAAEEEDEGAFGGQPVHSTLGAIPVEDAGTALGSQHAPTDTPAVPYSVFQQGSGADAADEEDEDDESDLRAQAPLQHALKAEPLQASQNTIDDDDADTRVPHEVEVEQFTRAAESRQLVDKDDDSEKYAAPEASSPPSTVHSQYATNEFGAAQVHAQGEPLAPALSVDDFSDTEMAPPRVTRPLPAAPVPPPPGTSDEPTVAQTQIPPPPAVPRRTSLSPPTRAVPSYQPDNPPLVQGYSPQRTPSGKRTSIPPPSRGIPVPAPETPDVALQRRQSLTKRTSVPPPTRAVPSPSAPYYSEPPIVPPPPPLGLGYAEQEPPAAREPEQVEEAPQLRDERVSPSPYTPARKPSLPPPVPDGRRSVDARRSTDPRPSHEERRRSGQYAGPTPPAIPRLSSPPSNKRAPPSLVLEKEVLDDDTGDPIDPRFHTPTKSSMTVPVPPTPPPTSSEHISSAAPASTAGARHGSDSEGNEELKRRRTIAERMAKLGAIKFGAPPPIHRVQPPAPAAPAEGAGAEGSTAGSGQPAPEEPEEQEEEEDEQARRQRIAAKLAGMGGMRFGMLPVHPSVGVALPSPPAPVRHEEEPTPRSSWRPIPPPSQPAAPPSEPDQEYEHPSSSDDGVQVEAEESELEEVLHEDLDLEDEYDVETVEEEQTTPLPPPPPLPRATRPPIPSARPPVPPTGRRPSAEVPPTPSPRSGSFDTATSSATRPPTRQPTSSDFVMVEVEEAQPSVPARPLRGPPPPRSAPSPLESSDPAGAGSSPGQWELPSIPSGSLDFGDGVGGAAAAAAAASSELSGTSRWSEDSTAYPAPAPPTGMPPQPQSPPARMTVEELRALWGRVGVYVAEAASGLLERSKRTLVGNGSYEGFVAEVLAQVPNASPPHAAGEYGFLVYAQTAAQVHARLADIMPGDVVVLQGARLKGHKGLQSYSMSAGEGRPCVGVVSEFDAKKLKLRALQANRRVGQATVESVSYRLEDLKSGTIKVYRVLEV